MLCCKKKRKGNNVGDDRLLLYVDLQVCRRQTESQQNELNEGVSVDTDTFRRLYNSMN